jgi:hypothetical protein
MGGALRLHRKAARQSVRIPTFGRPGDQRHSRGRPEIVMPKYPDTGIFMTQLTWQQYFEQSLRARLQNLAASRASGRELIERLRDIAADYTRFLFNDNSR